MALSAVEQSFNELPRGALEEVERLRIARVCRRRRGRIVPGRVMDTQVVLRSGTAPRPIGV